MYDAKQAESESKKAALIRLHASAFNLLDMVQAMVEALIELGDADGMMAGPDDIIH